MEIKICIPSYKRPIVETLEYLPNAEVYVSNEEYDDYVAQNPSSKIIGVDPKYQGNLCRIRNHILDLNKGIAVCIVDDDLKEIGYWENKKEVGLESESEFILFLKKYTELAVEWGVRLWGINVAPDMQNYREYTPFSLTSYIGGPFAVHVDSDLRYDENLPLKEDYDMTLQQCNKYRKVLRVNKYFYKVRQAEQSGGCATYRNLDKENEQMDLLIKKWGSKIVKRDTGKSRSHNAKKERGVDINPIIHIPIKGI